jgi:hypothetical protein
MRCTNHGATVRSPSRNTPSAGLNSVRWQVSRLAEQAFAFEPRLPDLLGQWPRGSLRSRSRGRLLFRPIHSDFSPIAFPLRLS